MRKQRFRSGADARPRTPVMGVTFLQQWSLSSRLGYPPVRHLLSRPDQLRRQPISVSIRRTALEVSTGRRHQHLRRLHRPEPTAGAPKPPFEQAGGGFASRNEEIQAWSSVCGAERRRHHEAFPKQDIRLGPDSWLPLKESARNRGGGRCGFALRAFPQLRRVAFYIFP